MNHDAKKVIAEETRSVYLKQHNNYLKDDVTFQRFLKMVDDPSYFHLSKEDFVGKKVLDAGCGNSGYFQVAMHELGVRSITCLDLGEEWIEPLKSFLENYNEEGIKNVDYIPGSTDELPFEDESFDMVFSNGVLMHLVDKEQIEKAFNELARVTKKGGYLYIVFGCPGGILEEEIIPAIRRYYRNHENFKEMIDKLTPDTFAQCFSLISKGMSKQTGESFNYKKLTSLFDIDFCTTLQNLIQVPKRHILELDKDYIIKGFKSRGFTDIKRCKRFVKRQNLRKYLAPLQYEMDNPFSEVLYGPGNLEYIAYKPL